MNNEIKNLDEILNSEEFNQMFDFESEKKEIESAGWNMKELIEFAKSITQSKKK